MSVKTVARTTKAAADLTTSEDGWVATLPVQGATMVRLFFDYVHSDSTAVKLLLEMSSDSGDTWYEDWRDNGVNEFVRNVKTITTPATASYCPPPLYIEDVTHIRVRAWQEGGSATGNTLALKHTSGNA